MLTLLDIRQVPGILSFFSLAAISDSKGKILPQHVENSKSFAKQALGVFNFHHTTLIGIIFF